MRTQQKQRVETAGHPWVVKQRHWNTEANENHQLNHGEPRNRHKKGLQLYILAHQNKYKYIYKVCGKGYSVSVSFKTHLNSHVEEKT